MSKGTHLGDLEEIMLLAVVRLGEEAHGGGIRAELVERADRSVSSSDTRREQTDLATPKRTAAAVKLFSSTTATKVLR